MEQVIGSFPALAANPKFVTQLVMALAKSKFFSNFMTYHKKATHPNLKLWDHWIYQVVRSFLAIAATTNFLKKQLPSFLEN